MDYRLGFQTRSRLFCGHFLCLRAPWCSFVYLREEVEICNGQVEGYHVVINLVVHSFRIII